MQSTRNIVTKSTFLISLIVVLLMLAAVIFPAIYHSSFGNFPTEFETPFELGHNATRAYVNAKIVALNTILQNGDLVEIKKSRKNKGPNINWLNPELNFLSSIGAQSKVRQWFNKQNKNVIEREGKKILKKELTRLSIDL